MDPKQLTHILFEISSAQAELMGITDYSFTLEDIEVTRPKQEIFGNWSSNVALKIANTWKISPLPLAEAFAAELVKFETISKVEIAGPGFINIFVSSISNKQTIISIREQGALYGNNSFYLGTKFNLEFVSANPTGPIHLGGSRWAAVGDSLARILKLSGAEVTKEYYFNDHGSQIEKFVHSLKNSYKQLPPPEKGYGGKYIEEIVENIQNFIGPSLASMSDEELNNTFRELGIDFMFTEIKSSLINFGVIFDVYFHEESLHHSGAVQKAINRLRELGHVYDNEGAIWLNSKSFGDLKDRVVIKSNGEPAYIAADIAYYLDKRERGFDRNIMILGADHHGYVKRLMAVCSAFGDIPGENLEILIGQMVNLIHDGKPVRMSKRNGTVISLEDLVEAVGRDAARYSLTRNSIDTPLDIDLDVLQKKSNDNPIYYVQYAHARACSVLRNAAKIGLSEDFMSTLMTLDHSSEKKLISVLQDFPRIVLHSATFREPHRIARYLEELAGDYHRWFDNCRVLPQGEETVSQIHVDRLSLNNATAQVLRNGLTLLGVSAPERM